VSLSFHVDIRGEADFKPVFESKSYKIRWNGCNDF